MTELNLNPLGSIQDKYKLKGNYVFLSFAVTLYVFNLFDLIKSDILTSPSKNVEIILMIITLTSINSTSLYFIKIEKLICSSYLYIKSRINGFSTYKEVSYNNSINHPYISGEMNKFFSKILFIIALLFISLMYLDNVFGIIFLICTCILITVDFLNISFKPSESIIKNKVSKTRKLFKFILYHITTILTITLIIILIIFNIFNGIHIIVLLIMIFTIFLIISFSFNWSLLENKIKLIYFRNLFVQDKNLSVNEPLIIEFVDNVKKNLWKDAIFSLNMFVDEVFSVLNEDLVKWYYHIKRVKDLLLDIEILLKDDKAKIQENKNPFQCDLMITSIEITLKYIELIEKIDDWIKLIFINDGISKYRININNISQFLIKYIGIIKEEMKQTPKAYEDFNNSKFVYKFIEGISDKNKKLYSNDLIPVQFNSMLKGYFDTCYFCLNRLDLFKNFFVIELQLETTRKLKKYQSRKAKKLDKKLLQDIDKIKTKLMPYKKNEKSLEEFFASKIDINFYKIKDLFPLYSDDKYEELFIRRCAVILGKEFFKIFKK